MPEYYLILQRRRSCHVGVDETVVDLEGETLEEARAEADRRLRGDPEEWRAEGKVSGSYFHVEFHMRPDDRGTFLHPSMLPFQTARILQVVDERPVLDFHEEVVAWGDSEKERITAEFAANPEYVEYQRLRKKFETPREGGS